MSEVKMPLAVPPEMKENAPAVKVKKKSPGVIDNFVQEEPSYVGQYLIKEIVLPAVKNLIFEMGSNAMSLFLFGETKAPSSLNRTRYSAVASTGTVRRVSSDDRAYIPAKSISRCSCTSYLFPTKIEAERKLFDLKDLLEEHGVVSVANYLEMLQLDIGPNDGRYGWYNLDKAFIEPTREGQFLNLPKPQSLDD